jgi:hypothetical protein
MNLVYQNIEQTQGFAGLLQLLADPSRTHLVRDLELLALHLPEEDGGFFPALLNYYTQVIVNS